MQVVKKRFSTLLQNDENIVEDLASRGYFTHFLLYLMLLAKSSPDIGSRLMPIFVFFANYYEEHKIPKEIFDELIELMEKIRNTKGFAITSIDGEGVEVSRV